MTRLLVKSFGECSGSTVLTATCYWPSNHCIPAQKFVSVSGELNINRSPLLLDSDKGVCCHHSSLLWCCLHPLNKFQWVNNNSRYGFFPNLLFYVINRCGVINMTWTNHKHVVCDAVSCTWHALPNERRVKQWIHCTVYWKKKSSTCNVCIRG